MKARLPGQCCVLCLTRRLCFPLLFEVPRFDVTFALLDTDEQQLAKQLLDAVVAGTTGEGTIGDKLMQRLKEVYSA